MALKKKQKTCIDMLVEASMTQKEIAEALGVVEQLKGKPPKAGGTKSMTKAEIMAVKNRAERQKLILEHQELFN